jgi:hypothetical protein
MPLPSLPGKILGHLRMRDHLFPAVVVAPKLFLGKQFMQHVVALLAKLNTTRAHLFFRKPLLEPLVAVNRARNEMMKAVNDVNLAQLAAHATIIANVPAENITQPL